MLSVGAFAQTGKSLYEKYSDLEGVEAVYISPAMFKMIGRLNLEMGDEDVDIARLVRSLKGMYILICLVCVLVHIVQKMLKKLKAGIFLA